MKALFVHPRSPRLATILALLAVVAQLWVSQVRGAEHLAQVLAGGVPWSEICSAPSAEGGSTSTGHESHLGDALSCAALCTAGASRSATLPGTLPHTHTEFAQTAQAVPPRSEPQFDGRDRAALRPPAQAPPAA